MKTFKDLKFKPHSNIGAGFMTQAIMNFSNLYGVSVVTGSSAYASTSKPYEIGILREGCLTYDTPITDDVIGYNSEEEVTKIMERVQKLPNPVTN